MYNMHTNLIPFRSTFSVAGETMFLEIADVCEIFPCAMDCQSSRYHQPINTIHQASVKQSSLVKDLRESLVRLDLQHRQNEEQEARRQIAEPVEGGKPLADGGDGKDGGRGNPIDVETSMSFRSEVRAAAFRLYRMVELHT